MRVAASIVDELDLHFESALPPLPPVGWTHSERKTGNCSPYLCKKLFIQNRKTSLIRELAVNEIVESQASSLPIDSCLLHSLLGVQPPECLVLLRLQILLNLSEHTHLTSLDSKALRSSKANPLLPALDLDCSLHNCHRKPLKKGAK